MNSFYTYNAFGLTIHSAIELLTLLPANSEKPADIFIIQQKIPETNKHALIENSHYKLLPGEFCFSYKGNAFHYSDKTKILSVEASQIDVNFWQALYGPVFSIITYFFNKVPLHASGIILGDKVILISGASGSGKSSIAWLLMQKMNARFFADDITVLEKKEKVVQAYSTYPEIKLWDDIMTIYQLNKENKVHPEVEKYFVKTVDRFSEGSFIPGAVIFVQVTPNHKPEIEKISGTEKFSLLYKYLYRKQLTKNVFPALDFQILTLLANQTSVYLLSRPQQVVEKKWTLFITDTFSKL